MEGYILKEFSMGLQAEWTSKQDRIHVDGMLYQRVDHSHASSGGTALF